MAQFDVYRNPDPRTNSTIPYLVDLQSDLLDILTTRVVVPLVKAAVMGKPARYLNPSFDIEGQLVVMSTPELAGVSLHHLGDKAGSLAPHRDEIIAALDLLFTGF